MAIQSHREPHTVGWLKNKDEENKLLKDISIQRKDVWDVKRKSDLIVSVLLDIPIESLLYEERGGDTYNVLDGKQRTLTLCSYVNNEFVLSPKIKVSTVQDTNLIGLRFEELPEEMRKKIMDYELSISVLRQLTEEERAIVFFMRNQAVSLSKIDLSRAALGSDALKRLSELCNHSFMTAKINMSAPARRKHDDLTVIMQYLLLKTRQTAGFSGAEIMSLCDDIKNNEVSFDEKEIQTILAYLDEAIIEKKPFLKKVHLPIIIFTAQKAMHSNVTPADFGAALLDFFADLKDDSDYMIACKEGSAKNTSVQKRVKGMGSVLRKLKTKK